MRISDLHIQNFKSISSLKIPDIEKALILVGKNNTGKTQILNALRAALGDYEVKDFDFNEKKQNMEISMILEISTEDLRLFHSHRLVSQYRRYDVWLRDFCAKLPSFCDGRLSFSCIINYHREIRYHDGFSKHNRYIPEILPRLYFISTERDVRLLQEDLFMFQENGQLVNLRSDVCMFDSAKVCSQCFSCLGLINQKRPQDLQVCETAKLLEYKMYQLNLNSFSQRINENYHKNGGTEELSYTLTCNRSELFHIDATVRQAKGHQRSPVDQLGNGMKSIYMLSLLETYVEDENRISSIIMVEYPELFLHPSMQKTAGEILYRLSKKNQVIFTTHSPNMIANFGSRQLCQVQAGTDGHSLVRKHVDIDEILDDLGYSAVDLLNVGFVFIVEGKQDKSRLPLLLENYYSELHNKDGNLTRISILTTNSCTNIRTYANLKYMNQVYLRDHFLMIRDGDGKDPNKLAAQLCQYYDDRNLEDADKLPKVRRRNVLILKYYSFENYFLNPKIMTQLGIIEKEEDFWEILFEKWQSYLGRLSCGIRFVEILGREPESPEDLKAHFEEFRIYMRGHNLFDIFYGQYKKQETELLKRYIQLAPREEFEDILNAIDAFAFFDSRKNQGSVTGESLLC